MRLVNRWMMRGMILSWLGAMAVSAQAAADGRVQDDFKRTVTVQGQGKVIAVPDIATLSVEVSEEGAALEEILSQSRVKMNQVMDVLKKQSIGDRDIQTQLYQVQPKLQYDKAGNSKRVGYRVTNRLSVKVRDLPKAGKVLAAVVDAGASQVTGPDFEVDNPQKLERDSLERAVEDARDKAQILARAARVTLGDVQTIMPMGGPVYPMPKRAMMMRAMAADSMQAEEPISAGEQTITSNVQVVFELK